MSHFHNEILYSILGCYEKRMLWRPRHWNLLENKRMPLIKVLMRQRPQNVLERPCERASVWFPTYQCLCTLADQSGRGSYFRILPGQARLRTFSLSAPCVALHMLVRHLSHSAVPSSPLHLRVGHC